MLFLAVLGRRLWWAAAGPLLYLYFLVPFGDFLTPRLQDITTWFIRHGLDILGIPAFIDGYVIEIPQGTFFVAEACAGLRFLIASIAFGCLYALMMYRSPVRRGLFILVSIIVPIIANGFRGLGIVVLGYLLGSAQAAAADHIIYGWLFFSLVILLLIALGLPFREDTLPIDPRRPRCPARRCRSDAAFRRSRSWWLWPRSGRSYAGPGAGRRNGQYTAEFAARRRLATVPPPPASSVAAVEQQTLHVVCGGEAYDIAWQALPPRVTAGSLMAVPAAHDPVAGWGGSDAVLAPCGWRIPAVADHAGRRSRVRCRRRGVVDGVAMASRTWHARADGNRQPDGDQPYADGDDGRAGDRLGCCQSGRDVGRGGGAARLPAGPPRTG